MSVQDAVFPSSGQIRSFKIGLWIAGVTSVILGALAILFPLVATLAAELLFGILLAALGVLQILRAAFSAGIVSRIWVFVFGFLSLTTGAALIMFPLEGAVTLTILLATFFVLGGIVKLWGAWQLSPPGREANHLPEIPGWSWLAFSGILSLVLGVVLFLGLPVTAVWAVGLLIGLDLTLLGASEIALALALSSSDGMVSLT
ncbi:HdeD family acid-resistance protein [Ruegeria marina]|uniref:Uncharacterized membrane protein HdeD, DUF308 family n=1 Tax=Ruegeria marina TaxID=639004 RepID=A0A1G6I726_9RHOB|nr:DUF308 domain-containing protein [Ruegeria marina]SDC02349.1 Uncharacterized membrane protein HdeD, DUF308 family [Ruegeria marina]